MAGGGGNMEGGEPEFQVAPMIDVLLVLLIFFMSITQAQVEQLDNTIKLPVAPDARPRKPDSNQRTVNVRWLKNEGKAMMTYNGKEWDDREALAEELKAIAANLPHPTLGTRLEVLLRADRETPAKEVQAAMQVIAQATAKIAFATHNK
jgi:biopolymer transport protein ExbD